MNKALRMAISFIFIVQMIGCSALRPVNQPVNFTCDPKEGVELIVSGKKYICPVTVELPRNREFSVEGYKEGHEVYKRTISYHSNTTFIILDIVGGCIWAVPFLGLLTPGTKDLDETDIYVKLMRVPNQSNSPEATAVKP